MRRSHSSSSTSSIRPRSTASARWCRPKSSRPYASRSPTSGGPPTATTPNSRFPTSSPRRQKFTLAELGDEVLADPAILALADRVNYEVDPRSTFPRHYCGEVIVTTRSGRTLRHREQVNRGNAERPLASAEIVEKFRSNAARAVSAERAGAIERSVLELEDRADVATLADKLSLA